MSELNLKIDDGREKIYINKDKYGEDRVIYVNLGDINIFVRAEEVKKNISSKLEEMSAEENTIEQIKELDKYVREQIDYVFDYEVSEIVFGKIFAVADIGNGKTYVEEFLEAIMPVIEKRIEKQSKKMMKYVGKYVE